MQLYDDLWNLGYYLDYDIRTSELSGKLADDFRPFIMKVVPRLASIQENDDQLNLICFEGRMPYLFRGPNDEAVFDECRGILRERVLIRFGLEPLRELFLLDHSDTEMIIQWFENILDFPDKANPFRKHLVVDDNEYTLLTAYTQKQRRLCIVLGHINS